MQKDVGEMRGTICTHWLLEDFSGKNQNHENIVNLTPKHFDDVIFRVLICRISTDF